MVSKNNFGETVVSWRTPWISSPWFVFSKYVFVFSSLHEKSDSNSSPLTMKRHNIVKTQHANGCPHRKNQRPKRAWSKGIRESPKFLEYADCPFQLRLKMQTDGSYILTSAQKELKRHHEVSKEELDKYRKTKQLTKEHQNMVISSLIRRYPPCPPNTQDVPSRGEMCTTWTWRESCIGTSWWLTQRPGSWRTHI